jgi:hypothetical protein
MRSHPTRTQPSPWWLVCYVTEQGQCPVRRFLRDLRRKDPKSYVEFRTHWVPLFVELGPFRIGPPHWEGLGGELYDIRWGRNRIYCSVEPAQTIMMLLGRIKMWRTFDNADRRICEQRLADVRSDSYEQAQRETIYEARHQRGEDGTL